MVEELGSEELEFLRNQDQHKDPFGDDTEKLICECNCVTYQQLKEQNNHEGKLELCTVQAKTKLGTGCGSCLVLFTQLVSEVEKLNRK